MWTITTFVVTYLAVMISLKAFTPMLAGALGMTPAAMYERQRALIRANVLPAPVGRGRGHGLPANAETVAWMIIAAMVTDNLSDTDDRVQKLANANFREVVRRERTGCGLTRKRIFRDALVAILNSDELAAAVFKVRVARYDLTASIHFEFGTRGSIRSSSFGGERNWSPKHLVVESSLSGEVLRTVGKSLRANQSRVPTQKV
jgi:hypothetical protein